MKLNNRARNIAHFQRIERGSIRTGDKEMKFETLLHGELSPASKEMFLKRLDRAHERATEKRETRDKIIKEKTKRAKP